jgi:hypothetical protein
LKDRRRVEFHACFIGRHPLREAASLLKGRRRIFEKITFIFDNHQGYFFGAETSNAASCGWDPRFYPAQLKGAGHFSNTAAAAVRN